MYAMAQRYATYASNPPLSMLMLYVCKDLHILHIAYNILSPILLIQMEIIFQYLTFIISSWMQLAPDIV